MQPTAAFGALLFVLFAMWYAASSQNNAAAYLLFFALGSVFAVSIPHTLLNLRGLEARLESVKPAFAGDEVSLPIEIVNRSGRTRRAICIDVPGSGGDEECLHAIKPGNAARSILRFPAPSRGEHVVEWICLRSVYPLGLLRVVKSIQSRQRYIVYPKPAGDRNLPTHRARFAPAQPQANAGEGDEFAGLRAYIAGESQRHIDWRAVARGQPLMTKQYSSESNGVLHLDFGEVHALDMEARLAQLALWIIEAERARRCYGLRLPGTEIAAGLGDAHFHRCLRALALFE